AGPAQDAVGRPAAVHLADPAVPGWIVPGGLQPDQPRQLRRSDRCAKLDQLHDPGRRGQPPDGAARSPADLLAGRTCTTFERKARKARREFQRFFAVFAGSAFYVFVWSCRRSCSTSSAPSHLAMTIVATLLPIRLVIAIASPMKRWMPRTSAMRS